MSQGVSAEIQTPATWFSRSKTRAPRFSIPLVERKRLLKSLDAALDKPISCVVAPAGFGKTTLLSQWRDSLIAQDIRCAWINVDENDSEIRQFFAYLVFAFEDAGLSFGYLKDAAEKGFVDMSSTAIVTSLLSAIIDIEEHMVLVLDDYHRVTCDEIDEFVGILSDQCGDRVHIAIGSRTPVNVNLPKLLAAGQAIEIPSVNLRFSEREVREAMGPELNREAMDALQDQVEGWPVAVQMLRLLGEANDFAKMTSRAHKIASQGHLADYLVTNVLDSQTKELRDFLLETSILESFNAELAEAVCSHSNGQSLIRQLTSLQALVIPLDDDFEWFRYHHLFSECLSELLKRDDPAKYLELHRRAAKWCGENRMISEAVNYANAVKDYDLSKDIINDNRHWMRMLCFGGVGYVNGLFSNFPAEEILTDPRMLYAKVYASVLGGDFRNARQYHDAAEAIIDRDGITPQLLVERLGVGTGLLRRIEFKMEKDGGWLKERLETIETLKAKSPKTSVNLNVLSSFVNHALAIQSCVFGDFKIARTYMREAKVGSEKGFNPVGSGYLKASHGVIEFWSNEVKEARRFLTSASENVTDVAGDYSNVNSVVTTLLCAFDYWQSALEDEVQFDIESPLLRLVEADGWYDVYAIGFDTAVHDALCRQDYEKADALIGKLEQSTDRLAIKRLTQFSELLRLNIFAVGGSPVQAEQSYDKVRKWFSIDHDVTEEHGWFHWVVASFTCAQYFQSIEEYNEALRYVEAGLTIADELDVVLMRVRGNILKASILESLGKRDQGVIILENAIQDAVRVGCIRAFACDVSKTLLAQAVSSVMDKTEAEAVKAFATRLAVAGAQKLFSSREEEVLHGIAQGKSNKEIARELDLTENTIKFHLRNIYRKLDVKKRVPAVEKARELGIL